MSKKQEKELETPIIIELNAVLEYRNDQVYIKKMNTSEMPVTLTFNLIEALNKTIVEYYKPKENEIKQIKKESLLIREIPLESICL